MTPKLSDPCTRCGHHYAAHWVSIGDKCVHCPCPRFTKAKQPIDSGDSGRPSARMSG